MPDTAAPRPTYWELDAIFGRFGRDQELFCGFVGVVAVDQESWSAKILSFHGDVSDAISNIANLCLRDFGTPNEIRCDCREEFNELHLNRIFELGTPPKIVRQVFVPLVERMFLKFRRDVIAAFDGDGQGILDLQKFCDNWMSEQTRFNTGVHP